MVVLFQGGNIFAALSQSHSDEDGDAGGDDEDDAPVKKVCS